MLNFLNIFKKTPIIKSSIYQIKYTLSNIEYLSSEIKENEIVLFLLLIYARIYKNCYMQQNSYKDDLNNLLFAMEKDILSGSHVLKGYAEFILYITTLIKINGINKKQDIPTKINLNKIKSNYILYFGYISDTTIDPFLHLYSAILLFQNKINDKIKFIYCFIDLANRIHSRNITIMEAVNIPYYVMNNHYM